MITTQDIRQASTIGKIYQLVNQAAAERNCQLEELYNYAESAEVFKKEATKEGSDKSSLLELVEILTEAEKQAAAKTISYDGKQEFIQQYTKVFELWLSYDSKSIGARVYAQKLVDMHEAHPEWAEEAENLGDEPIIDMSA